MKSRRAFLCGAPLTAFGVIAAESPKALRLDGPDSATSVAEIKKEVLLAKEWKETEFAKRKYLFALTDFGDGESYIDVHGWIYDRHFQEWRRILNVKTRNVGNAKLRVDAQRGIIELIGTANNNLKGVEVFRLDLRATDDSSAYLK